MLMYGETKTTGDMGRNTTLHHQQLAEMTEGMPKSSLGRWPRV